MSILRKMFKILQLLGVGRYRRGLRFGTAAAIEHESLIKGLEIRSLIDVGANKGQFSLLVREHHPGARIYAVEPLSEPADIYEGLFAGDANVTLLRCAAGARPDTLDINISGRADSSSILPITVAQEFAFAGTGRVGTRSVPVEPLDALIDADSLPRPILIKLDVQGYELEALKGMPQLMANAGHVYLELSFQPLYAGQPLGSDVVAWLAENGFDLAIINDVSRSDGGVPVQADVLFKRRH